VSEDPPELPSLGPPPGVLSPGAARVLYAVADAWTSEGPACDVLPLVERRLRALGVPAVRRTWLLLRALEWQPVLWGRRRFWFLPRAERRALLDRWARSRVAPGRALLAELHEWVSEAHSSGA
jgi:hypothetical protein